VTPGLNLISSNQNHKIFVVIKIAKQD